MYYLLRRILSFIISFWTIGCYAQCPSPEFYDLDFTGTSSSPEWTRCVENTTDPDQYLLEIYSDKDIQNYVIDWGDGSPTESSNQLLAGNSLSHNYNNLGIYTITFTETDSISACSTQITGTLYNDRKPVALALPPISNTSGCAPLSLTFTNQSTNTSPLTFYIWTWGDGIVDTIYGSSNPGTPGNPITHIFNPPSALCGFNVRLTAVSSCANTFVGFGPFNVYTPESPYAVIDQSVICDADTLKFTDMTSYSCATGSKRIQWDFSELGGTTTAWLPLTISNKNPEVFVDVPTGNYNAYLSDSNICGVNTYPIPVYVEDAPQASLTSSQDTICNGSLITFTNNDFDPDSIQYEYNWNLSIDGIWNTDSVGVRTDTFTIPGDHTMQLSREVVNSNTCRDTASVNVHVLNSVLADFSISQSVDCDTLDVMVTDNSSNISSWFWSFSNGDTSNLPGPFNISYTDPGSYTIRLIGADSLFGCQDTLDKIVSVYSSPTILLDSDTLCAGQGFTLLDNSFVKSSNGGLNIDFWHNRPGQSLISLYNLATYPDSPDASLIANDFQLEKGIYTNIGTRMYGFIDPPLTGYYIFEMASFGESELFLSSNAYANNKVKIASVPNATGVTEFDKYPQQKSDSIYLESGKIYYIESSFKGPHFTHQTVRWTLPDGNVNEPISGQYLSKYTIGNYVTDWNWDLGDGNFDSTESFVAHTYNNVGDYYISLEASTGFCSNSDSVLMSVKTVAEASFTITDSIDCNPLALTIVNQSSDAIIYYWDFGDGGKDTLIPGEMDTINYTYYNFTDQNRDYTIILYAENSEGCVSVYTKTITVKPGPDVDFDFDTPSSFCSPLTIPFTNYTDSNSTFLWYTSEGDTLASQDSIVTFTLYNSTTNLQFDTIYLEANLNGCLGRAEKVTTTYPVADFNLIVSADTGCSPLQVSMSVDKPGGSFDWQFGDGTNSTQQAPTHTYTNSGIVDSTYNMILYIENPFQCADTLFHDFFIAKSIFADFEITPDTQDYPNTIVTLTNNSLGDITNYYWNFDDGTDTNVSDPGTHDFILPGSFDVWLTVSNQYCIDSTTNRATILVTQPIAQFNGADSGCAPLSLSFTNNSLFASTYFWDFGDGSSSTAKDPIHTFQNPGSYSIMMIATGPSGSDTTYLVDGVLAVESPVADFTLDENYLTFPNTTATFTNTSSGPITGVIWNFNDNSSTTTTTYDPGSFNYVSSGVYPLTLVAENGVYCKVSYVDTVTVFPFPAKADFNLSSDSGCAPLKLKFNNLSTDAYEFTWYFGNGDSSKVNHPEYVYPTSGTYTVTLKAIGPSNTDIIVKTDLVTVSPSPFASFNVYPDPPKNLIPPAEVLFDNHSLDDSEYFWDFGDGSTSTEQHPSHTYTETGDYDIILIVKAESGCSDTIGVTDAIQVVHGGRMIVPNAFTPTLDGPNDGNINDNGLNNIFYPKVIGIIVDYEFTVYNRWGVAIFHSTNHNIGWNGYRNGKLEPAGSYVYTIQATFNNGTRDVKQGNVLLIR